MWYWVVCNFIYGIQYTFKQWDFSPSLYNVLFDPEFVQGAVQNGIVSSSEIDLLLKLFKDF